MYRKTTYAILLTILTLLVLVSTVPPARAQFVLAAWDFPGEYGQGIYGFFLRENSTGVFMPVGGPIILPSNSCVFDWPANVAIGFDVRVYVNYTYIGLSEPEGEAEYNYTAELHPALNYLRLNITVLCLGEIVFSQQNFTYSTQGGKIAGGVWYYAEECDITDFLPATGTVYTAIITYEVYGPADW